MRTARSFLCQRVLNSQVALQTGSGEILAVNSSLMQKIYTGLDEPDGLKGIATLRASNTLRDHIVDLENSGKWRDAFMCYDQVHTSAPALRLVIARLTHAV
jgi:hypothetical protein